MAQAQVVAKPFSARIKRFTLIACVLASSVALLDATIVNVALPAIQRSVHGGLATQQWVVDAYALTLGALILVGGSLGDVFGQKRVFEVGVAGFGLMSLACALAPSAGVLIAARALQGVASALLAPASLAVITTTFPESERGRAIGSWTAWSAIATIAGPLVGGALVNWASWRWIFLVNLPLVAITLALIVRFVPGAARVRDRHLDLTGGALAALGLGGPVFALIEQPRLGWTHPATLGGLVGGAALLVAFYARERLARDPMLPLRLFARRNFSVANLETLAMYAGLTVLFFLLAVFLQEVAGWSPTKTGVATVPATLVMFALSPVFGGLADRLGPRFFMGAGPVVAAAGLLLFLRLGRQVSFAGDLLPALLVFAVGLAMSVAPLTTTVLAGVQDDEAGIASAVNNAVARVAGLAGVAALGPLIGPHLGVSGFHLALGASAVLLIVAGVVGTILIRNPSRAALPKASPSRQTAGTAGDVAAIPASGRVSA